jgi:riboflavin biosynthesis pyrimidine reductase
MLITSGSHATEAPAMIRRVMDPTEPRHTRVLRRVHPEPAGDVTVLEAYGAERPRHADGRPWLGLCMVSSLDGSTVVHGRSSALSSENDSAVLLTLRDVADVLLVGAGTVRAEGYGSPRKPGQRIGVVSRTGDVDVTLPVFACGAGFLVVPRDAPPADVETVRAGTGTVDFPAALTAIGRVVPGARYVQAEGGPRLNAALFAASVVDELDLTVSPRVVGGDGPRLTTGAEDLTALFDLGHLLVDDEGFVFSRWLRRRA